MKFLLDVHTHTTASGHAYSSLQENVLAAKEKGLLYYGVSDHGPMLPGTAHIFYFQNIRVIPREMFGMKVLRGVEANILDEQGTIDMSPENMKYIDYVIASIHMPCFTSGGIDVNTNATINAMKHPKVNIIGHPDDGRFPIDYERIVSAAKEEGVLLELNNGSLNPTGFRSNVRENVMTMLKLCMEKQVPIIVNSDAHISMDVGEFGYAKEVLTELNFPKELIINLYPERFLEIIKFTE